MQFIEHLVKKIRDTGINYNTDIQLAPSCILWPDYDRQWEEVIPLLLNELPELLILGEYDSEKRKGPAIWIRSIIARKNNDLTLPNDRKPIIYLPSVSRQDLRAVENCPDYLKPLAELQYRGVIWSQVNAKDWTILAFLKSDQGGLGLDVAQDADSRSAMQRALEPLLYTEIELLKGKKLDKEFFNNLITGDNTRVLLSWLEQGDAFRSSQGKNEWRAFVDICKSNYSFDPEKDGILTGAMKLAMHNGAWLSVWQRFCEAPKRYPNIPGRIRKCKPPSSITWYDPDQNEYEGWPQWNEEQENILRNKLVALENTPPNECRKKIAELEKTHGSRRSLVWAELGEAPLAHALEYLSVMAEATNKALASGSIDDLAKGYQNTGWQADDAVIQALSYMEKPEDFQAVKTVIRLIYRPWAEESARYLQKIVDEFDYPGGTAKTHKEQNYKDGECVFFVDGLRFDVAKRLAKMLKEHGNEIEENIVWAALPSITATGKPAVTPVHKKIYGKDDTIDFEPCIAESGQSLKGGNYLKNLLEDSGWKIIESSSIYNVNENAWTESGNIDHEGHERGWKLSKYLEQILIEIKDQVLQLQKNGWKRVRIVTDHGWLLLPGNLPKIELPKEQTETKWGRCAAIKPGASTDERLYPWYWNPDQHFALADGISCFRNGKEYDHGGLSFQECLTLELIVSSGLSQISHSAPEITDEVWKRLRLTIAVDGEFEGLSLDVRIQPGDPSSSVVVSAKSLKDNGTATVVVENEGLEGTSATIVLINKNGELMTQKETIIGGGIK